MEIWVQNLLPHSSQGTMNAIFMYSKAVMDPGKDDTWSQLGELNLPRFAHSAMLLEDFVFIIGGFPGK